MADIVAPLSEDERAVLMIAAEGMPMIPIGRWEDAVKSLARRGFLVARNSSNYVITPAGRTAIEASETQAVRDVIKVQNRVGTAMKPVYSSHIDQIGYDPVSRTLSVQWDKDGGMTHYAAVPPEIARQVMFAPSIGEALHAHIRGRYEHETVKG